MTRVGHWLVVMLGTTFVVAFLGVANPVQALRHWVQRATHVTQKIDLSTQVCYSEVIPGLYLSNIKAAQDINVLRHLNITHVLTIEAHRIPKSTFAASNINNLFIKAYDTSQTNLMPYFPMSNAFIEEALTSGGNVLVHCRFGVSRSATLVIAYLMQKYNMNYDQAFEYVKSKRFFINPNPGFVSQLQEYHRLHYGVNQYQRFEAYCVVKARKHKYKIVSAAVILVTILVPVIVLIYLW
ncbi:uncharacterized protein LOC134801406 [Cydia splendana]|uniref:uncharacterized protein LOC134801406 n=1 Tax=Cydia splendana TaxID=1100963 RepID=UPI00300C67AC